jgi:hypothetical protein
MSHGHAAFELFGVFELAFAQEVGEFRILMRKGAGQDPRKSQPLAEARGA